MRKKRNILFMTFMIVLGIFFYYKIGAFAYTDNVAPLVKSAAIHTKEVTVNDSFSLVLDVVEEDTGIKWIDVRFYDRTYRNSFRVSLNPQDNLCYTGLNSYTISLPELGGNSSLYSGTYDLVGVELEDQAGNRISYYNMSDNLDSSTLQGYLTDEVCDASDAWGLVIKDGLVPIHPDDINKELIYVESFEFLDEEFSYNTNLNAKLTFDKLLPEGTMIHIQLYQMGVGAIVLDTNDYVIEGTTYTCCFPPSIYYDNKINPEDMSVIVNEKYTYAEYPAGVYYLDQIWYDCGDNSYVTYCNTLNQMICQQDQSVIDVVGDLNMDYYTDYEPEVIIDTSAPKILEIRVLGETEVVKPAIVKLEVDVWDDRHVEFFSMRHSNVMYCYGDNSDLVREQVVSDGIIATFAIECMIPSSLNHEGLLEFTEFEASDGIYHNNVNAYDGTFAQIYIKNEFDIVKDLSLTDYKLAEKVGALEEGQTARVRIRANKGTSCIAKKEVFEAIKGKNVNIMFDMDADTCYQWIINGMDVTNPKDIELTMKFKFMQGTLYGTTENILCMEFSNNGVLPGVMSFRFKSAYVKKVLSLDSDVYIYYDNEKSGELELEDSENTKYLIDDTDAWLYFDMTHNSTYLSTDTKLTKTFKSKADKCIFRITNYHTVEVIGPINKNVKSITIPKRVKYNGHNYTVTSIGAKAFKGCKKLKTIKYSNKIRTIGASAFENCTALKEVTIPIVIEKIGKRAFYNCKNVNKLTIKGIRWKSSNIGKQAFSKLGSKNYKKLKVKFPKNYKTTYKKLFKKKGLKIK